MAVQYYKFSKQRAGARRIREELAKKRKEFLLHAKLMDDKRFGKGQREFFALAAEMAQDEMYSIIMGEVQVQ